MTEFNADELHAPEWMDKQFIQDVLRSAENDNSIDVIEFKLSPATEKGDHYASIMFRANIQYRTKNGEECSKSVIIKTMPAEEGHKKDLFNESDIFKTEIGMYLETIPKFEELLIKAGDHTKMGAKMLYYSMEPRKIIIFEDIVTRGYQVIRNRQLNLEETKAVLLKLAKWHAVSYKLGLESNPLVTRYDKGFFDIPNFKESDTITKGVDVFTNMLSTQEELKTFVPQFKEIAKDLVPKCVDIFHSYQNGEKGIFVLNHGDFHAKNMMFRKNEDGTTDDVLLIDFQVCFYGPATVDLTYSIFTFFNEDVRTKHREEVIYYYFVNFLDTLRRIEFTEKLPTLAQLHTEFIKNRKFEIFMMTTFFPLFYAFTNPKNYDISKIMQSLEYRVQFYLLPCFIEEMKEELPKYLYRGYLD